MPKILRPHPRRPAWMYPVETLLTLKDGRVFEVASERVKYWDDPSVGRGGGDWAWKDSKRFWRRVS